MSRTVATAGAVLAVILTPIQSAVYNGSEAPPLVRLLSPLTEPALSFADWLGLDAYHFYGRMVALVYLTTLLALRCLRLDSRWFRACVGLFAVAFAGDVLTYWFGDPGEIGFAVETAGLAGALLALACCARDAHASARLTRVGAWAFGLTAPAVVVVLSLVQYLPHAALLPVAVVTATVTRKTEVAAAVA
ncbi:hypothetical protein SAMN05216174_10773 [Actinokineospora iranica]|uniref:Uncharacterized protein n=2 Tax=Actinokineospora iranica TaxID=1271860 RepID=A0A1G6RWU8_9PSEU|nr:hypothetical protein SAMN05216174_10773 [Actinokineospora iranica]